MTIKQVQVAQRTLNIIGVRKKLKWLKSVVDVMTAQELNEQTLTELEKEGLDSLTKWVTETRTEIRRALG